jgi:hypothetical protein
MRKKKRTKQISCWFKPEELALIKEAVAKTKKNNANLSLSYLLRRGAILAAEQITGKRISPV